MSRFMPDEEFFDGLSTDGFEDAGAAPSVLKSRVYSALLEERQESGRLLNFRQTKQAGNPLCVFEELVRITPLGEPAQTFNCCSVCHARVLAENFERAPIYWGSCPYVQFQKGSSGS